MSDLGGYSFIFFYGITAMAAVFLAIVTPQKITDKKGRLMVQISWGGLILGIFYFVIAVPYVNSYFEPYTNNAGLSTERIVDREAAQYVSGHDQRIGNLERELKQTKNDLGRLTKHYERILMILMFVAIFYGTGQITKLSGKGTAGGDPGLKIT